MQKISQVRRFSQEDYHDYPYRSHGQPLLAYVALIGCVFVLLVANGASLWGGFYSLPFLSSYLIVRETIWLHKRRPTNANRYSSPGFGVPCAVGIIEAHPRRQVVLC
jgi:hypothetical protein